MSENMDDIIRFFKDHQKLESYFPFPYAYIAENEMKKIYEDLNEKHAKIHVYGQNKKEFLKLIQSYLEKEYQRKDDVEDKAKSSVFIIALSLSFILSSLTFIYSKPIWIIPKLVILSILIVGVIFLVLSSITSIKALFLKGYNDLYLDGRLSGEYNDLEIIERSIDEEINILYECIKLNEILTNIKVNYVDVTFAGIRNGVTLIAVFFILTVLNSLMI